MDKSFSLIADFLQVRILGETFLDVLAESWASGYDQVATVTFSGFWEFTSKLIYMVVY